MSFQLEVLFIIEGKVICVGTILADWYLTTFLITRKIHREVSIMQVNFVTVCTDNYPMYYAEKITNRFKDLTKLNLNYYCITDRPEAVNGWAEPIAPFKKSKGWWNKINLFGPNMPNGWILYMDVDIVITKNFDEEIMTVISGGKDINCVSDAIEWKGEKFSSSLMILKSGSRSEVFAKFVEDEHLLFEREGGDQVWAGPLLGDINFIDETFPNLKKNLKFQLGQIQGGSLNLPRVLPSEIKLIDCSGDPKPHQLGAIHYVKENWHNVPPLI